LANLNGVERAHYVQGMFTHIARRYDLMNRLMTAGQDVRWRREVIRRAALSPGSRMLDLGTGTGNLGREALRQCPVCRVVSIDFTIEMMRVGRSRQGVPGNGSKNLSWAGADVQQLPFPDESFEAVVSGFLLRNVSDLAACLAEQSRVLKAGGKLVALDTTPLPHDPLASLVHFHLHTIIPSLGRIITRNRNAYQYLADSTESFLEPEKLASQLELAGFHGISFRRLMFGSLAIYWGSK
jgi:demethylmenaquinone methyltransferase/2-methoxy-6-polyprenyl-1,4-benzoquinol methylase